MKKIAVLFVALCILLTLVACGNEKAEKYCWNCGEGIKKNVSFCSNCGSAVNDNQSSSDGATTATTTATTTTITTTVAPTSTKTTTTKKQETNPSTTATEKKTTTIATTTTTKATTTITETKTTAPTTASSLSCPCHLFSPATCTEPKKCSYCGLTQGSALGHNYVNGACSRCYEKDPTPQKIYSLGETWVVDGEFKVTVNSVTAHYACHPYWNYNEDEQIILIDYTFENIGYVQTNPKYDLQLYISPASLAVYDEAGEISLSSACKESKAARDCIVGTKCNVVYAWALKNASSTITVKISHQKTNKEVAAATFTLPVSPTVQMH